MFNILGKVLLAPIAGPISLGIKLIETIRDQADLELNPSESQIKEKLVELEMLLESQQITEQIYEDRESALMDKWRKIQQNKGA